MFASITPTRITADPNASTARLHPAEPRRASTRLASRCVRREEQRVRTPTAHAAAISAPAAKRATAERAVVQVGDKPEPTLTAPAAATLAGTTRSASTEPAPSCAPATLTRVMAHAFRMAMPTTAGPTAPTAQIPLTEPQRAPIMHATSRALRAASSAIAVTAAAATMMRARAVTRARCAQPARSASTEPAVLSAPGTLTRAAASASRIPMPTTAGPTASTAQIPLTEPQRAPITRATSRAPGAASSARAAIGAALTTMTMHAVPHAPRAPAARNA
jgi:hypothetical protein